MQPLVIDYLKNHSFEDLEREHGVEAHSGLNGKFSLNYNSITAKSGNALAEQCRGMVVRKDNDEWRVLAWPMNRFYNHGDVACAPINWNDPELMIDEKLDGTMCALYHDDSSWCVATRSVPEADLPIKEDHIVIGNTTFSQIFMNTLEMTCAHRKRYSSIFLMDMFDKDVTYIFELTSPYNRVVVAYDEPRVTLLAARNRVTGKELDVDALQLPLPRPKTWATRSINDLIKIVNDFKPTDFEGVVVKDSNFNRIKIKSLSWCFASKTKDAISATKRNALLIVLEEKIDDVAPLLEADIVNKLNEIKHNVIEYSKRIDQQFLELKRQSGDSRKEFALLVKLSGQWHTPLFALLDKKAQNTLQWLQTCAKGSRTLLDTVLEVTSKPT